MATSITILTFKRWDPGTYNLASSPVPTGLRCVKFKFDVTEMTSPAISLSAEFEFSFDGGVTWRERNAVSFQGGPIRMTDLSGNPIVRTPPFVSTHEVWIGEPENANRRVRGSVKITGSSFRTTVSVEIY